MIAIRLRLHQQHLLGQPVGRVGLLGVAVPQIVLAERHRRELRIRADGAGRDQFLQADAAAFFDELHAHHQVVVEKLSRVDAVGADAAHARRQVHDQVGLRVAIEPPHRLDVDQVVVARTRHRQLGPAGAQLLDDERAEKTGAAGHDHALAGQVHVRLVGKIMCASLGR